MKPVPTAAIVLRCCAGLLLLSTASLAQTYPQRPIRFIVPFAPGGGLDITARLIAPKLSQSVGKPVVVDNRPGAGGAVGLELTARATPDGHVLAMFSASHVIQAILTKANFDLFRDLAPVSEIIASPYVFVVYPGLPAKSVRELIAYAKANQSKLNYASAGNGTLQHLSMELFGNNAGIKVLHVPYKGVGPALPDLFAGRIHMMMSSLAALAPHIRNKSLHALAVTSNERSPVLAELPTMIEAGVPGFVVTQWQGTLVPAGTPRAIVDRLQKELSAALQQPDIASFLSNDGSEAVGSTPQRFSERLENERSRWTKVVQEAGIRAE